MKLKSIEVYDIEGEVRVVGIRRATAKDIYGLDFSDPRTQLENVAILISRVSNMKLKQIERLDIPSLVALSETAMGVRND